VTEIASLRRSHSSRFGQASPGGRPARSEKAWIISRLISGWIHLVNLPKIIPRTRDTQQFHSLTFKLKVLFRLLLRQDASSSPETTNLSGSISHFNICTAGIDGGEFRLGIAPPNMARSVRALACKARSPGLRAMETIMARAWARTLGQDENARSVTFAGSLP